ncbi:MAG: PEP-CTERM sorting domain-containing protein [Bryobacteraceae bacterium]|jgi:hypothetical protein
MQSVGSARTIRLALLVSGLIACIPAQFGGVAKAEPITTVDIFSLPGMGSNNISAYGNTNVSILVSPAWAVPSSSQYGWISYTQTGCDTFDAASGRCTPDANSPPGTTVSGPATATFYQPFTLTTASSGYLDVWADDTAAVYLVSGNVNTGDGTSGTLLMAANPNPGPNCASGPIGCLSSTGGDITFDDLQPGTYTVVIDAYQYLGGTPFGIMYDGELSNGTNVTPEPASYMLMALGLGCLGTFIRRRKKA